MKEFESVGLVYSEVEVQGWEVKSSRCAAEGDEMKLRISTQIKQTPTSLRRKGNTFSACTAWTDASTAQAIVSSNAFQPVNLITPLIFVLLALLLMSNRLGNAGPDEIRRSDQKLARHVGQMGASRSDKS